MSGLTVYVPDIRKAIAAPNNAILSQTLHNDDRLKVVLFSFAPGQELSTHAAPCPVTLYFAQGEAIVQLGDEEHQVRAGAFAYLPEKVEHAICARTQLVMLLTLLKNSGDKGGG